MSRGLKPKRLGYRNVRGVRRYSVRMPILPGHSTTYQSWIRAILLGVGNKNAGGFTFTRRIGREVLATKKPTRLSKGCGSQEDEKTRPGDSLMDALNKKMASISLECQGKIELVGGKEELEAALMDTIYDADEEDNADEK